MKKIVTLLLTVIMTMSVTIVTYAKVTEKEENEGVYSLISRLETYFFPAGAKDIGIGWTWPTTEDVTHWDSRAYVCLQAQKSDGTVIDAYTNLTSEQEAKTSMNINCKKFRVRSYLVEPMEWKFRVMGPWITHSTIL